VSPRSLTLVQPPAESAAARAVRMQAETKALADEAYQALLHTLELATQQAREVAALEALPYGIRDTCPRLATEIEARVKHMTSIRGRIT
jgi:hypothetical protein